MAPVYLGGSRITLVTEFDAESDSQSRKRDVVRSFEAASDAYRTSDVHREGADLTLLASWCAGAHRVLDVACGAGHTAGAVAAHGPRVVACDAAGAMVRTAVDDFGVSGVVADAESLPFSGDAFDGVTCRIAAHHFPDPVAFLDEVGRVLEPGGVFAFEDNVLPDETHQSPPNDALGAFVDRIERLRDPTHVESYTVSRWIEWIERAGFDVRDVEHASRRLAFDDWVDRTDPSPDLRGRLDRVFAEAAPAIDRVLDVERDDEGGPVSFLSHKVLIRARLRDETD